MLQRARTVQQQQQQIPYETSVRCSNANLSQSPVQLAQSWGTPIWTTDYTLKFLDKVTAALKLEIRPASVSRTAAQTTSTFDIGGVKPVKSANVKQLKGDYIKIEAFQKHYRPYYSQFKRWPTINLNSELCPFVLPSDKRIRGQAKPKTKDSVKVAAVAEPIVINNLDMTRKTRNKQVRGSVNAGNLKATDIIKRSTEKHCGYCEICRVEYDVLSIHLQSKEHLNFVKNSDNFLTLDTLINNSANVETFLKMNSRASKASITLANAAANSPAGTKQSDIDSGLFGKRSANSANSRHLHSHILQNNCDENMKLDDGVDDDIALNDFAQMNGLANEQLSPKLLTSPRDKLPKYSPPMTRRSHTKQPAEKGTRKTITSPTKLTAGSGGGAGGGGGGSELNDEASMAAARARRETAKRINYAELKEEEENLDEHLPNNGDGLPKERNQSAEIVPVKRIIRPFPRYKVVDDEPATPNKANAASRLVTDSCPGSMLSAIKQEYIDEDDDGEPPTRDAAGLIVKFKRVRESELSKLTFEADNFMFPKQRDDLPTDEDRQTTSEAVEDASSELITSELDDTRLATPSRTLSLSESSDQFTSSGRRKKRRAQFDSSITETTKGRKSGSRQRFREPPTQPRINTTRQMASAETNIYDRRYKSTRRCVKSSVRARAAKRALALDDNKLATADDAAVMLSGANESSEDRVGENTYNGGSILSTDLFQQYKFAFERVPCNEPWYLAFQRQDESREKIFEYWGNTGKFD